MKINLICLGHENIGLEYISASLKKQGYDTVLTKAGVAIQSYYLLGKLINKIPYSQRYRENVIETVVSSMPDLIGFSVFSDTYGWSREIAEGIKRRINVPVVFGGIHPTAVPEEVIKEDFIDYVCVGEGEEAMVELVQVLGRGGDVANIKNIWSKKNGRVIENSPRPLISNLDSLPFPDKELFYSKYSRFTNVYSIITSRGCPYNCSFCCNNLLRNIYKNKGDYLRRRSVANVIKELVEAKQRHNIKNILFADDVFTANIKWLEEFCGRYKSEVALPFTCEIHPLQINRRIVRLLESAGCVTAGFGLQTIGEGLRKNILNRYETNEQIASAIDLFKDSKIYLYADVLLDIPGQDEDELADTARFLNRHPPDMVLPFHLRYYPRTDIVNIGLEKGALTPENAGRINRSRQYLPFDIGGVPHQKHINKILTFVLISKSLPGFAADFILGRKLYRWNLPLTNILFHLYCLSVDIYKKVFRGKRQFNYFPFFKQVKFFFFFLFNVRSGKA